MTTGKFRVFSAALFIPLSADAVTAYSVGGTVQGLYEGNVVILQNNGSNDLPIEENGPFTFTNLLPDGGSYNVTVLSQPTEPDQTCSVTNGNGNIDSADVTDIQVTCEFDLSATCPGGIGDRDVLVLSYDYDSGETIPCKAENSITLGPDVYVLNNTTLHADSPQVFLQGILAVELGSQLSVSTKPNPRPLNDTGLIYCADDVYYGWACPLQTYPGQDAEFGRDVTHYDDTDGHAGFSFTKLDENGDPLPAEASNWSCVRDNVTGLTWEVKTDDEGLQDRDHLYSWYNSDSSTNGGHPGWEDGGGCTGSKCDSESYVNAINTFQLCGANDWRMPTATELQSIAVYDRIDSDTPAIDINYFPNDVGGGYWSGTPAINPEDAIFSGDFIADFTKAWPIPLRLVRGGK